MAGQVSGARVQDEVKTLIRFYERRGWNWLDAVEFTLSRHSGRLEYVIGSKRIFRSSRSCNNRNSRVANGA